MLNTKAAIGLLVFQKATASWLFQKQHDSSHSVFSFHSGEAHIKTGLNVPIVNGKKQEFLVGASADVLYTHIWR